MHKEAYQFVETMARGLLPPRRVLELGSRDVNGSVRPLFRGAEYVGMDRLAGKGVDVVADAATWRPADGRLFDLVVCTEALEHTPDGEKVCRTAYGSLLPGGAFLVTAAGPKRRPHSALGGRPVQPGEYYANVTTDRLRTWLAPFGFCWVREARDGEDVQALAVKVNDGK